MNLSERVVGLNNQINEKTYKKGDEVYHLGRPAIIRNVKQTISGTRYAIKYWKKKRYEGESTAIDFANPVDISESNQGDEHMVLQKSLGHVRSAILELRQNRGKLRISKKVADKVEKVLYQAENMLVDQMEVVKPDNWVDEY